jgi:hypothetical protein
MFKDNGKGLILQFLTAAILAVVLAGCGLKAAPVPPRPLKPPVVNDLSRQVDGSTLKLTWTIPTHEGKIPAGLTGFSVYRAKIPLSEFECKDCPLRFRRVAAVPIKRGLERPANDIMTYNEMLGNGYRYIYKVVLDYDTGEAGTESNWVDFVYR